MNQDCSLFGEALAYQRPLNTNPLQCIIGISNSFHCIGENDHYTYTAWGIIKPGMRWPQADARLIY